MVNDCQIMNITGFRKALKKFEKTTKVCDALRHDTSERTADCSKIYCMEMYTDEKIARGTFAKGSTIDKMIKETEELFTTHFGEPAVKRVARAVLIVTEHGNQKKARDRLRRQTREKTVSKCR